MTHPTEKPGLRMPLRECPPGLFRFDGILGFKTEYGMTICDENGAEMPGHLVRFKVSNYPDAYVLESGEVFWGGAKSHDERSGLLVEPLTLDALTTTEGHADERAKVIEECAKVAEESGHNAEFAGEVAHGLKIATAIRALQEKPDARR